MIAKNHILNSGISDTSNQLQVTLFFSLKKAKYSENTLKFTLAGWRICVSIEIVVIPITGGSNHDQYKILRKNHPIARPWISCHPGNQSGKQNAWG
jgi:hypothetical protein